MRVPPHTAQVAMVWTRSIGNPLSEKALEVRASGERNESFALGKRFTVAKLTASISPRAKLRPRLLVTSGRLFPSPDKDLLIPSGRAGLDQVTSPLPLVSGLGKGKRKDLTSKQYLEFSLIRTGLAIK